MRATLRLMTVYDCSKKLMSSSLVGSGWRFKSRNSTIAVGFSRNSSKSCTVSRQAAFLLGKIYDGTLERTLQPIIQHEHGKSLIPIKWLIAGIMATTETNRVKLPRKTERETVDGRPAFWHGNQLGGWPQRFSIKEEANPNSSCYARSVDKFAPTKELRHAIPQSTKFLISIPKRDRANAWVKGHILCMKD